MRGPENDARLPPGQRLARGWPVRHYGPVPKFRPQSWDFQVLGAVEGGERCWTWPQWNELPRSEVAGDFHCVTRFSLLGSRWGGVAAATLVEAAPPAPEVTHVMVWAEYGYSANLTLADFLHEGTVLAMERDGEPLSAEHGFPLRLVVPHLYAWKGPKWVRCVEYLTADRRGFWEQRGYHNAADPWREQRYAYQEEQPAGTG